MADQPDAGKPAPSPEDLRESMERIPEGPNVEYSPWESKAARGETPLEGPRAGKDSSKDEPKGPGVSSTKP
jgi:hypothetical protein